MRPWLAMALLLLSCGSETDVATGPAPTIAPASAPVREPEPEPDPRVDLLEEELARPEALGEPDLQLEMPELGSDLPGVILVPPAELPDDSPEDR